MLMRDIKMIWLTIN